jgi:hypothetical protein
MTGTNCDLFIHKSVPVIFEPPCILLHFFKILNKNSFDPISDEGTTFRCHAVKYKRFQHNSSSLKKEIMKSRC